ncbi:DUF1266 domain-containing protein [Acetivibrio mesophilus]|uniref:DUF1266 domain-containing protein n=1 Tax=Acetivibrio mesophilus TaxID=2487273 RepID=A0A4Q0I405_9FIRM|nr:DUF1266 domain-containing protein [Acetivibrio mesophilus]RXE58435.1 DUF1266 domain-containing protein [Acetivibrio mesophilus]
MANSINVQLWGLSLSLTSIWGSEKDFEIIERFKPFWKNVKKGKLNLTKEILQGIPESSSSFFKKQVDEKISSFLNDTFNISDENSCIICIKHLFNGSNLKKSFEEKRRLFVSIPQKDRAYFINSFSKNRMEFCQYSIINQYGKYLPSAGILAYDISNCISICRLGLYMGYLNESSLQKYLNTLAKLAQENYCDFEEFGLASTVGVLYSLNGYDNDVYSHYLNNLTIALTNPESPWNNIDWNIDLSKSF